MAVKSATETSSGTSETLPISLEMPSAHHATLAQLAMLHDEARQTSLLANLLGRAPYAACTVFGFAIVVAGSSLGTVSMMPLAVWIALIAAGSLAAWRSYAIAIKAPFDREPLIAFAKDLSAIMLYAGFAWGVGAFLAIPETAPASTFLLFSAGMPALMAAFLRSRDQALYFLAPAAGLPALIALVRGDTVGLAMLVAGAALAAAIFGLDRLFRTGSLPDLPRISLG